MNELLQQLRIVEQAHQHAANFQKSLLLLRALKAGQVSLDNVVVTDDGWTIEANPAPVNRVFAPAPTNGMAEEAG